MMYVMWNISSVRVQSHLYEQVWELERCQQKYFKECIDCIAMQQKLGSQKIHNLLYKLPLYHYCSEKVWA